MRILCFFIQKRFFVFRATKIILFRLIPNNNIKDSLIGQLEAFDQFDACSPSESLPYLWLLKSQKNATEEQSRLLSRTSNGLSK